MREIRYRQAIFINGKFSHFHYWGFTKDSFVSPETDVSSIEEALKNSDQYTGLRDRRGVEIYEGDIIRGPFRNGLHRKDLKKNEFNCSVYFYLGHFGFKPHGNVGDFRWFPYWNECVVIGNIYEHPELLSGRPIEGEGP